MTTIDTNEGVRLSEKSRELKEAMDNCLHGDLGQCQIENCLGTEMKSGLGLCQFHFNEKLRAEEEVREKHYAQQRKQQAKVDKSAKLQREQTLNQRMQIHFNKHRCCAFCGHFCEFEEGSARVKKVNPQSVGWEIGPKDKCYETICIKCEKSK